jgi:hypothetical protein
MHEIPPENVSAEFAEMWSAAGRHLERQSQGPLGWLKADLDQPLFEHLSFRLGNQLFFIYVEDSEGMVVGPGDLDRLLWGGSGDGRPGLHDADAAHGWRMAARADGMGPAGCADQVGSRPRGARQRRADPDDRLGSP